VNRTAIHHIEIADEPATWEALAFALEGEVCRVGSVSIRLVGCNARRGLVGWALNGIASDQLDGLPTRCVDLATWNQAAVPHPNGVIALDHVVAVTPALDRTVAALRTAGLDLRRIREEPTPAGAPRQAFFRLGDVVLEVVQAPDDALERSGGVDGPAFFWGLAFKVADLDATVATIGADRCSSPRPAVQPGRRIATLRRSAGLAVPVALMTQ
jgi:hypothetical protein